MNANTLHCPSLKFHTGATGGSANTRLVIHGVLQVPRACLYVMLGAQDSITEESQQRKIIVLNNIVLVLGVLTGVVNSIISGFDMSEPKSYPVL